MLKWRRSVAARNGDRDEAGESRDRGLAPAAQDAVSHAGVSSEESMPVSAEGWYDLATALYQADHLPEAIAPFQRAIELGKTGADIRYRLGNCLKEAGRMEEALGSYREVLRIDAGHARAHNNLGTLLQAAGDKAGAMACYRRAVACESNLAIAHQNLAVLLQECGDLAGAIDAYREMLALDPGAVFGWANLGYVCQAAGRVGEAADAFRRALALAEGSVELWLNLGGCMQLQRKPGEALEAYENAAKISPTDPRVHNQLGSAALDLGRAHAACVHLREAIRLDPGMAAPYVNLGLAFVQLGKYEEAERNYRKAIEVQPDMFEAHMNLAALLGEHDKFEAAGAALDRALQLRPDSVEAQIAQCMNRHADGDPAELLRDLKALLARGIEHAVIHLNIGTLCLDRREIADAIASLRRALELDPHMGDAHFNLGAALLLDGNFSEGWAEYEWRWKLGRHLRKIGDRHRKPLWGEGGSAVGKTLLLHCEQGYGDTIQFVRYVNLVRPHCARLVIECPAALQRLLSGMPALEGVFDEDRPQAEHDVHFPLLSLPRVFAADLDTIPADVPYLGADEATTEKWRKRVAGSHGLRVGLTWSSNVPGGAHRSSRRGKEEKSIPFAALKPLFGIAGVTYFSLQKGAGTDVEQVDVRRSEMHDWSNELTDFAETAALIENLDLVISIDTAVAHLGGALGKPTWTLLPFAADWRWLQGRSDNPWYPTMRIFRQAARGDWSDVVGSVRAELSRMAGGK